MENNEIKKIGEYMEIPLEELRASVSREKFESLTGVDAGPAYLEKIKDTKDIRKILEDKVVSRIGKKGKLLTDKLFDLINGVFIAQKTDEVDGKMKVVKFYQRPPDRESIVYALDRVLGRPRQVNVQANFSLSKLLINTNNGSGSDNNKEVSEESDVLHRIHVEASAPADQG